MTGKSHHKRILEQRLTPTEEKFANYLMKRDPSLTSRDIPKLLSDFKRFVKVVQRIKTEPQITATLKNKKKIIEVEFEEFKKLAKNDKGLLVHMFRELNKIYEESK
jgi:hypothetical protein